MQSIESQKGGDTARKTRNTQGTERKKKQSFFILHPPPMILHFHLIYLFHPSFESKGPYRPKSKSRSRQGRIFVLISHSSNSLKPCFLWNASLATRVGWDFSYLGLERELDGFDGPISYCTVQPAVYRQTKTEKQEEDNVFLPLYLIYPRPRPVVEKIYIR